jgi:hypothetical protein
MEFGKLRLPFYLSGLLAARVLHFDALKSALLAHEKKQKMVMSHP